MYLSYLKHIVCKYLRSNLLQILDMIIINHHDKLDETCCYAYSIDVFGGCYSLFALKKITEYIFLSGFIIRKSYIYQEKDSIN